MKILFLTTDDSTFWSHRLALARAIKSEGIEVVIMSYPGAFCSRLEKEGFRIIPWDISRLSMQPLQELKSLLEVIRVYRTERPDLLHHIALKPIVYGSIANGLQNNIPVVNTITGMGPIFIGSTFRMVFLRRLLATVLKLAFQGENCRVICQNKSDRALLAELRVSPIEKTAVVPGFGVDIHRFLPLPEGDGVPIAMLPSRLLWEKGVREFVTAAQQLRTQGVSVRMVLVGKPDPNNPGCIPTSQIKSWVQSGIVEWWGHLDDMPAALCRSHIVCMPSYGEGLPKVLLEAGACGRAIVTTRVPGCSDVVRHGENGLLVEPRDSQAIAATILCLLQDKDLRAKLGTAGRTRVVNEFSDVEISRQIIAVYRDLWNRRPLPGHWLAQAEAGSKAAKQLSTSKLSEAHSGADKH